MWSVVVFSVYPGMFKQFSVCVDHKSLAPGTGSENFVNRVWVIVDFPSCYTIPG